MLANHTSRPTTCTSSTRPTRVGFTLIELLVVIAIIGTLISILLPALGKSRSMAKMARELAGAQQMMLAYTTYANDNAGALMVGYPTEDMMKRTQVLDDRGEAVTDIQEAQRYPWRLLPYMNYDFRSMYFEQRQLEAIRDDSQYVETGKTYRYVVSLYPSLGMNIAFLGGSDLRDHLSFTRTLRTYGKTYLSRIEDAQRSSNLITFASARAGATQLAPSLGKPPGYFRVGSPYFTQFQGKLWDDSYDDNAEDPIRNSGGIALRFNGKAVTAMLDGHAQTMGWNELGDMRHWSDAADATDWKLTAR
jgi:prepilin-type N-terminal cleavage/methylation domain-containing protein